jgi:putative intracellular protease/amidase
MGRPVVSISGGKPAPPIDRGFDVALRERDDPQVALVARLLAEGPSWSTIYKIIDAVGDTLDGKNDRKLKAWIPELDRIGGTANARETALEGGRHATKRYSLSKAKKGRIPLDEAWSAVTRLVDAWLRWRPQVVPAKPDCEPPAE